MEGDVKKFSVVPKILIPADTYMTESFDNTDLIQVHSKNGQGFVKSYFADGLDGAELIPVELGGRLVQPSVSINELGKQLLKASSEGNLQEIKALMNKGAPFTADWLGTSPLHLAAQNNHLEVCEILLRAGISKDARTKVDRTPLHMAAYEGHMEIVKCLLVNKADVDCKDLLAMTPLHWAAQNCHLDIAELLVRQGAQRDAVNKFDLTPLDIAIQCNRHDIANVITTSVPDPEVATHNLTLELSEMDNNSNDTDSVMYPPVETLHTEPNSPIPLETVFLDDIDSENSIDPERLHISQEAINHYHGETQNNTITEHINNNETKFSDSLKLLQQHGITMLPADDDTSILSSIIETGHSVVLTDIGKEVLNSTKPQNIEISDNVIHCKPKPQIHTVPTTMKTKKIITMTPQEFLAMTLNQDVFKHINGKSVAMSKPAVKRIVMKKNKIVPITANRNTLKIHKQENLSDIETLMRQLIEARKLVEEYKQKFLKKEAEAERYKQQLLLITQTKNIC